MFGTSGSVAYRHASAITGAASREPHTLTPALNVADLAVSVVIPAYNEEGMLARSVRDVVDGLRARAASFEVIVVENGSTDRTRALAEAIAAEDPDVRVRALSQADYGEALRTGILASRGRVVVIFDTDYYDLDFLDRALARLDGVPAPAIVVGSKRAPGTRDDRPLPRRVITAGYASLLRIGFGLQVSDTHGMKALDRAAVTPLARRVRNGRDLFDTELVLRADREDLVVVELPVTVTERRPSRTPIARRVVRTTIGLVRLRILLWRERVAP